MKRLAPLALMLPLVSATPSVAQITADMGRPTVRYGPEQASPEKKMPQPRERSYQMGDIAALPAAPDRSRMIAAEQVTPDAKFGLGLFPVIRHGHPLSVDREPIVQSRSAGIGLAVKFKR